MTKRVFRVPDMHGSTASMTLEGLEDDLPGVKSVPGELPARGPSRSSTTTGGDQGEDQGSHGAVGVHHSIARPSVAPQALAPLGMLVAGLHGCRVDGGERHHTY